MSSICAEDLKELVEACRGLRGLIAVPGERLSYLHAGGDHGLAIKS